MLPQGKLLCWSESEKGGIMPASAIKTKGRLPKKRARDGYTVNIKKQHSHIKNTSEYIIRREKDSTEGLPYPSRLKGDIVFAQELVDKYRGKGVQIPRTDNSHWEEVKAPRVIGKFWDQETSKWKKTRRFIIVYSKQDTHVFPIGESKLRKKEK